MYIYKHKGCQRRVAEEWRSSKWKNSSRKQKKKKEKREEQRSFFKLNHISSSN